MMFDGESLSEGTCFLSDLDVPMDPNLPADSLHCSPAIGP